MQSASPTADARRTDISSIPGLKELWSETLGDPSVCIATLDGPVDRSHVGLRQAQITELQTGETQATHTGVAAKHGTHVASVIFGQHDGPVKGIAPRCRGLSVPVFRDGTEGKIRPCSQFELANALEKALEAGSNVINISGGQFSNTGQASLALTKAVQECDRRGCLVIAAAGNDGCECLHVPGALPSVLVVGAMNHLGKPLDFSNWGKNYRENGVLALGEDILGAVPGGKLAVESGTSFATPIVSGVAALLLCLQKKIGTQVDAAAVRAAILKSALGCEHQKVTDCRLLLVGRLNVAGAVSLIKKGAITMAEQIPNRENLTCPSSNRLAVPSDHVPVDQSPGGTQPAFINSSNYGQTDEPPPAPEEDVDANGPVAADRLAESDQGHTSPSHNNGRQHQDSKNAGMRNGNANVRRTKDPDRFVTASTESKKEPPRVPAESRFVFPTACSCTGGAAPQLVYALGELGFDFGTEARRDSLSQSAAAVLGADTFGNEYPVEIPQMLADYLDKAPWDSAAVIWTLNDEATPIYAIQAEGPYAAQIYDELRRMLRAMYPEQGEQAEGDAPKTEQLVRNVERVSIPGVISGAVRLFTGQVVPVIYPDRRGMYDWNTADLVEAACRASGADNEEAQAELRSFLDRTYFELRNMGQAPEERAINYAGTNAFNTAKVMSKATSNGLYLDTIEVERSPICRPDSDCWDVKLVFFNPLEQLNVARRVFRFTVDVSDVIPVLVGQVREWSMR